MSAFSADWLKLREPVDLRSRNAALGQSLRAVFATHARVRVIDLGCGTGANLRATAPLLGSGSTQDWLLVDHDPALLTRAAIELAAWADTATSRGQDLILEKSGTTIHTRFRQADLLHELDTILDAGADLVTASAFFDLASPAFVGAVATATARANAAFYAVLTFNGALGSTPAHAMDDQIHNAFNIHQHTDKGFGAAAGATAPDTLARAFEAQSYRVTTGDSPWKVTPADGDLAQQLIDGIASAALETARVNPPDIGAWRQRARGTVHVGHTDTLALPPG